MMMMMKKKKKKNDRFISLSLNEYIIASDCYGGLFSIVLVVYIVRGSRAFPLPQSLLRLPLPSVHCLPSPYDRYHSRSFAER